MTVRAPFPWFGGKSRAAGLVWPRFGDVPNYVEPFAGSLAVLLARPTEPRIETVNDVDAYLSNFWRAVAADPDMVAHYADWPVNEADLHARHRWLVSREEFREQMKVDPDFHDAKIAGWWLWGICQWIGSGWCSSPEWTGRTNAGRRSRSVHTAAQNVRPDLSWSRGINAMRERNLSGAATWRKRPVLAHGNRGINLVTEQRPMLRGDSFPRKAARMNAGAGGAGRPSVTMKGGTRGDRPGSLVNKMPKMDRGAKSRLATTSEAITAWMYALQDRLRRVRVCCGDWTRVLGRSATECIGVTGVFLDPPYSGDAQRDPSLYNHDDLDVAHKVREWAIANGDNPKLRIALCGYEGEHEMPATWECVAWKANGGYASSAGNHENAHRERIWFSPHCLKPPSAQQQRMEFIGAETARLGLPMAEKETVAE